MSFKVVIVGLGQIGMGYDYYHNPSEFVLSHASAFNLHQDFVLVGGVDNDPIRQEMFTKKFDCQTFTNLVECLTKTNPDIVVIATPTHSHLAVVESILGNCDPKLILCEKPLAYSLEDATKMVNKCESRGIKLFVNYHRVSDDGVIQIKKMVEERQISLPAKGICWYSKGLLNNGSHFVNLLQYWFGSVIEFELIKKGRLWDSTDPEPDFSLKFSQAEVIFLAAKEENFSHYTIELVCNNGRLRYDQGGAEIFWQKAVSDPTFNGYKSLDQNNIMIPNGSHKIQWYVVCQISKLMNGIKAHLCSADEGLRTIKTIDNIISTL